jgi:tetratricopeptide (TPR) repeat protein
MGSILYAPRVNRWLVALALGWAGCAGVTYPPVDRIMGGERHGAQTFVSPYAYEQYVRGELAAARGELEEAAAAFRRARTGPEDDPYVIARLAEVLEALGRSGAADAVLEEGFALAPSSEAVWLARGQLADGRGHVEAALEAYHRAEQAAPRSPEAPLALARLLREQGQAGRAEAVLRRFLSRLPVQGGTAARARLELALGRGDLGGALMAARTWLEAAPARSAEVIRLAELALEAGDAVMAAELLEALPRPGAPVHLRVRALMAAGRTERAEAVLATADAEAVGGVAGLGELYLTAGRPDLAEETLEVAVLRRDSPAALRVAGDAALALGHWMAAAERLSAVPAGTSEADAARRGLAEALEATGLGHLAAELQTME